MFASTSVALLLSLLTLANGLLVTSVEPADDGIDLAPSPVGLAPSPVRLAPVPVKLAPVPIGIAPVPIGMAPIGIAPVRIAPIGIAPVGIAPSPVYPTPCMCRSNQDCQLSRGCPKTCVFSSKLSRTGICRSVPAPTKAPSKAPTKAPSKAPTKKPTRRPITRPPTKPPTKPLPCFCNTDYDCQKSPYCPSKCVITPYGDGGRVQGQCQDPGTPSPTRSPIIHQQCCDNPRSIPTECEVRLLIAIMEEAVRVDFGILAQYVRMSFHDAGTHDQSTGVGGANGCLLNHPPMRTMPENAMLDLALETVATVKVLWEGHADTCLNVTAADMIQFAGWFAVLRQKGVPGLTNAKRDEIVAKTSWGRTDEPHCNTAWTDNLPGFKMGIGQPIVTRCTLAGGEIKNKMMDRNGFTAMEATALMGAHTIGMTRNVFGPGLRGTWTDNGADNATPEGPIFDESYHRYLRHDVVEDDAVSFATNRLAFNVVFPDWFQEVRPFPARPINHLDTDVALAFPSLDTAVHPDFHTFTIMYANDTALFIDHFEAAFRKMSLLGVDPSTVVPPLDCSAGCANATDIVRGTKDPVLSADVQQRVVRDVEDAVLTAQIQLDKTYLARSGEIQMLTQPVREFAEK